MSSKKGSSKKSTNNSAKSSSGKYELDDSNNNKEVPDVGLLPWTQSMRGLVENEDELYSVYLRPKFEGDRQRYLRFRRSSFSCKSFGIFLIIVTLILFARGWNTWKYRTEAPEISYAVGLCGNVMSHIFGLLSGYILLLCHYLAKDPRIRSRYLMDLSIVLSRWLSVFEYCFIICLTIGTGLLLIARSISRECTSDEKNLIWVPYLCNASDGKIAANDAVILTLVPLIIQTFAKCPHILSVQMSWIISCVFIVTSIVMTNSFAAFPFVVVVVSIGCVIYEIERRELDIYFKSRKIDRTEAVASVRMQETQRSNMQAIVLRQVVANISHDLLSPIQALDMGFESLSHIFEENCVSLDKLSIGALESLRLATTMSVRGKSPSNAEENRSDGRGKYGQVKPKKSFKEKLAEADAADKEVKDSISTVKTNIEDNLSSTEFQMKQCRDLLQTMRGSLTFMSMIINRCLDVSKVHGGIPLVPNCEYFNYMDSINKSVRYMMDMQNEVRVLINQCDIEVPSVVYTDKKWFEGNVFCILSNAIKYSSLSVPAAKSSKNADKSTRSVTIMDSSVDGPPVVLINIKYQECAGQAGVPIMIVEVYDCGPSIPATEIAEFFAAPQQSARKQMGGSGMGLYTLYKRIEALGGSVGARKRTDYMNTLGETCGMVVWFGVPFERRSQRKVIRTFPEVVSSPADTETASSVCGTSTPAASGKSSKSTVDECSVTFSIVNSNSSTKGSKSKRVGFQNDPSSKSFTYVTLDNLEDLNNRGIGVEETSKKSVRISKNSHSKRIVPISTDIDVNKSTIGRMDTDVLSDSTIESTCSATTAAMIAAVAAGTTALIHDEDSKDNDLNDLQSTGNNHAAPKNVGFDCNESSDKVTMSRKPAHLPPIVTTLTDTPTETFGTESTKINNPVPLPAVTPKAAKSLSVLVVDDSMSIMKIMKMSLERAGHHVQSAVNGKIALDMMMECQYDVVLMDLQMPIMGGIECCVKFREFELAALLSGSEGRSDTVIRTKRQLIIGMSANGEVTTRQDALDSDMDEFMAKPFSLNSMMASLKYLDPDLLA